MKHSIRTVVTTKCLPALTILGWCCWIAGSAAPAGAVRSRCGATIRVTDRAVLVSTTQTDATLKWGIATGAEPAVFANAGTCINTSTHRALNCMLGAPGTLAAITPPASCTIFLNDMTGECAALVKNCIPGVRLRDGSFPNNPACIAASTPFSCCTGAGTGTCGDPRVESAALIDNGKTLEFSGVNVQVDNGTGATGTNEACTSVPGRSFACCTGSGAGHCSPPNGLGNLFVGYNENPFLVSRTGSHNLIAGFENSYTSYGGLVVGQENTISAPSASVSGGNSNTASGPLASVSGGAKNTASGQSASVSGGETNTASDYAASVSGGSYNTASFSDASVSGGRYNIVSAHSASVSGGDYNTASGYAASVSGGGVNLANTDRAAVSGGQHNTASADSASVSGGAHLTAGSGSQWHAGQTGGFPAGGEY